MVYQNMSLVTKHLPPISIPAAQFCFRHKVSSCIPSCFRVILSSNFDTQEMTTCFFAPCGMRTTQFACIGWGEVYPLWALSTVAKGGLNWRTDQIGKVRSKSCSFFRVQSYNSLLRPFPFPRLCRLRPGPSVHAPVLPGPVPSCLWSLLACCLLGPRATLVRLISCVPLWRAVY